MPERGGPSTCYGILYQILGTSHWAANIRLRTVSDHNDFSDALLRIEPNNGGDVAVETQRHRIVEQWKTRRDGSTWSLKVLIEDVLRDLYRATESKESALLDEYRFVTEGRRGLWQEAENFFHSLRNAPVPSDPLAAISDSERVHRIQNRVLTDRELFDHITRTVSGKTEPVEGDYRRVWHLLSHFEMVQPLPVETLHSQLRQSLLAVVERGEDADAKINELCGLLLKLSAQGNVLIEPAVLLSRAGIQAESLMRWREARERLEIRVRRQLKREWHYSDQFDVRTPLNWPNNKPILVFSGESGQGKTWSLAAYAIQLFQKEEIATVVSATGNAQRDLNRAANEIWQGALKHESEMTIELLVRRCRESIPGMQNLSLSVLVDDVLQVNEAIALAREDWEGWGATLAITTLPHVARALRYKWPDRVHVVKIGDFHHDELEEFLKRKRFQWGYIASDVRPLLRRPILARLYTEIADGDWQPKNEYELCERFWKRVLIDRDQIEHPSDAERLRHLAGRVLDPGAVYPWSQDILDKCQLTDEIVIRLEHIGWLRRLDDRRVEITHDRLLNWAVAESLVAQFRNRRLTIDKLREIVASLFQSPTNYANRSLGYVPLDVLWLLADEARGSSDEVSTVLEAMEKVDQIAGHPDKFYENLLSTLDARIIPALIQRVRDTAEDDYKPHPRLVASVVTSVVGNQIGIAADWGLKLINDSVAAVRETGLRILEHAPHENALDRLWELHHESWKTYETAEGHGWWLPYERTFAALKSCIRMNSEWLKDRIIGSHAECEPVSELIWLVANLPHEIGGKLWRETKTILFEKVSQNQPRSLAMCCGLFRDEETVQQLEQWVGDMTDYVGPTALSALALIDSQRAVQALGRLDISKLYTTRIWWRPRLFQICPEETRNALRQLMAREEDLWKVARCYQDAPNLMDVATLEILLNDLERLTDEYIKSPPTERKCPLRTPLQLIDSITRLELIDTIAARVDTALEDRLSTIACHWVERVSIKVDHKFDHAKGVLLKIGGDGITRLVNRMLQSENKFCRLQGIELSIHCASQETRELLKQILKLDEVWHKDLPLLQLKACVALSSLDENRAIVETIMQRGRVLQELLNVRKDRSPMANIDLAPVLEALQSDDETYRTHAIWTIVASGRTDLIPLVRSELLKTPPDSQLARAVTTALGIFRDTSEQTIDLLAQQLEVDDVRDAAHLALLRISTPEALETLACYLKRRGIGLSQFEMIQIALDLSQIPEYSQMVAEIVWQQIRADRMHEVFGALLICLGELDLPEVREFLMNESYHQEYGERRFTGRKLSAIRGLAKLDREVAFLGTEFAFRQVQMGRELIPDLLTELDEEQAIPVLCHAAVDETATPVIWSIGRTLRRAQNFDLVRGRIATMLRSNDHREQRAAAQLAGWLPPDELDTELHDVALNGTERTVREAAAHAIYQRTDQHYVAKLIASARQSSGLRQWSLLKAAIELGDPWLFESPNDLISLSEIALALSAGTRIQLHNLLKKRKEQRIKEAADLDRKRSN